MINLTASSQSNQLEKKNYSFDRSNYRLEELQRRVPVVSDKALIDLVNGIQVSQDIIRYRKNRGFFGRIFDQLTGSDTQRQLLLDGNLIAGQQALHNWVLELTDSLRISQIGLQVTQNSLLEARNAIRRNKQILQNQEQAILALTQQLTQLAQQVDIRFQQLETRIHNLEVRVAANEDLDKIISAWEAEQTYHNLPWAIQVTLLAKEIFSSAVVNYELETADTNKYRELLINKILTRSQQIPKNFFSLTDLLDSTWQTLKTEDLELANALLEIRSIPQQRLINTPTLFTLGTTLELTSLPAIAKPKKPGQSAIEICRTNINSISRTTDAREFVTAIVEETANDCLYLMQSNFKEI